MNFNQKSAEERAEEFVKQKELKEYRIYQQNPELLKEEQSIYSRLMSLEDGEFKQLTQEMWEIIFDPKNDGKMLSDLAKVKEIAENLNELGGMRLMLKAYELMPKLYRGEVNLAWDGIGNWQRRSLRF